MKNYVLFYFLLLFFETGSTQNRFAVWQGFSHNWTYNHRLNRLGDFIAQSSEDSNMTCTLVHTAATGLGKDSASFQTNYAVVETNDIDFFAGKIEFKLAGTEGNTVQIKKKIQVRPSKSLQEKKIHVALQNGFDLVSVKSAGKLQLLKINIGDPEYNEGSHIISFLIDVSLKVNCSSLECNTFNNEFEYNMEIHYLVLGGNEKQMAVHETGYRKDISWDTDKEIQPTAAVNTVESSTGLQQGFMAYKHFSIRLDKEHHYLGYENSIHPFYLKAGERNASYTMNLFFCNWKDNMKQSAASGGQAFFATKRAGWAILEGTLSLVQFNSGTVDYHQRTGSMFWEGKNKAPLTDAAKNSATVLLK